MSSKGKAIADPKGKRKIDDDKTGGRNKKRSGVLQFFEDSAREADESDDSLDSLFGDDEDGDFLEDIFDEEANVSAEQQRNVALRVKEEEMTEEEHEKMLEKMVQERYKPGSSFVTYAEDRVDSQRSTERSTVTSCDPIMWKVKCMVGRERHSTICLMQKYVDLQSMGKKPQIITAFAAEHVKGAIFIEAYKKNDIYEACNGLCSIYPSRVAAVKPGEISNLLTVRSKPCNITLGTFARVKSGKYKGDLAQVVAVNESKRKATVKLIPRIDLQALAAKFGGGVAAKKTAGPAPPPRLISSSELEEFRPLIQSRRDRDSNTFYEVLDGMLLKDGYLYKKVRIDSLSLYGVLPSEDELLKFESSRNEESNDVEWLSELYGEQKKNITRRNDKAGGKGEGSSSSNLDSDLEVHDMVFFSRTGFGVIVGMEKDDSFKVLKEGSEGQVIVNVKRRELKKASFDNKFTTWDRHKKIISINDSVRILEGQLEGRQGVVKQIYRGTVFIYNESEQENSGYYCCKSQNCEKFKLLGDACKEKGGAQASSSFDDCPSSPKSPLSPKKPWQERDSTLNQGGKDELFSVGQSLRIRIGPLKGYLCRVLALRRSDVTVKLDSQHKILTVKAEHLVAVREKGVLTGDGLESKPFDLLGTQEDGPGGWMDGAGTSADVQGWGTGGQTTESNSWGAFPSSIAPNPETGSLDPLNSMDIDSKKDEGATWETKLAPTQSSSWGAPATRETALATTEQVGGWGGSDGGWSKAASDTVGGSNTSDSWGRAKLPGDDQAGQSTDAWGAAKDKSTSTCDPSASSWGKSTDPTNNQDAGWGKSEGTWGKENNASDNTTSAWGSANVKNQVDSWGKGKDGEDGPSEGRSSWNTSTTVADKGTGGWGSGNGGGFDGSGGGLYHGWQFEGEGKCVKIPQLPTDAKIPRSACVKTYEVRDSQGVVWVWMSRTIPPNPEKIPWFENFARPGFQDFSTTHELPYDHSILLENLMDPAHVPISHDRTDWSAKREDAQALRFKVTERTDRGFAGWWGKDKEESLLNFLRFEAPCNLQNNREIVDEKTGEKNYFSGLFLCRPSGQGKSMLIVRFGTTKRSPVAKLFPEWYFHQNASKVFEQDMGFLSSQNEILMKAKVPTKELYINLKSSDTWVAEYRKWMDKVGHGMPYHFGHNTISLPKEPAVVEHAPAGLVASISASLPAKGGIGSMHAPNLANRYFRHVIHCKECSGVVKAFETWKKAFAAIALVSTTLAILATGRQWKALLMVSTALCLSGYYFCTSAISLNTTNFIRTHRRL